MLEPIVAAERDDFDKPGRADQPFDKQQLVFRRVNGLELAATLYRPRHTGPHPAVIWIHGGGWRGGNRGQFARHAALLATHNGIASLCISYRLTTVAPYPACVQDARAAVRWLRANAAEVEIDPVRVAVGGSSAGGHIAAMIATNGDASADAEFEQPIALRALVVYNGVLKPPAIDPGKPLRESVAALFAGKAETDAEAYQRGWPINHITSSCPPTLLLHGSADQLVAYQESIEFADGLKAVGVEAAVEVFEGVAHGELTSKEHIDRSARVTAGFLARHLR